MEILFELRRLRVFRGKRVRGSWGGGKNSMWGPPKPFSLEVSQDGPYYPLVIMHRDARTQTIQRMFVSSANDRRIN